MVIRPQVPLEARYGTLIKCLGPPGGWAPRVSQRWTHVLYAASDVDNVSPKTGILIEATCTPSST